MADKFSRQLNNLQLAEHFLENVLELDLTTRANYALACKIVERELNIMNFDEMLVTANNKAYRVAEYRGDTERKRLHEQIVTEILEERRLEDDDRIELGSGGAAPNSDINFGFNAYILIGLPASGKSQIAYRVADENGAVIVDSDYVKRKLPEYKLIQFGATLVHAESNNITFGNNNTDNVKSVFYHCLDNGINMVIPKIGANFSTISKLINLLKEKEYNVHLTLVEVDRIIATKRALKRFDNSGRYVPLSLIFDNYSNNPTITFFKLLTYNRDDIVSFGIIKTDKEEPYKSFGLNDLNPANLFGNEQ